MLYHLGATTNSAVLPPLSLLLPPSGYEGEGALHLLPLSDEERDGPRSDDDDVYLQVCSRDHNYYVYKGHDC